MTIEHARRFIDGDEAFKCSGSAYSPTGESDAFERLGLTDPLLVEIADRAIDDVTTLLQTLAMNMQRFEEQSLPKRLLKWLGPPKRIDSVTVEIIDLSGFYAEVRRGSPYPIEISVGAVLRAASLCNEFAAVSLENASPCVTASIEPATKDGGLFHVMPKTDAAKLYARRLLLIGILFLFGHEFSHVSMGHCDLFFANQQITNDERCALELDADAGAGSTAAASIIQSRKVIEYLNYLPEDFSSSKGTFIPDTIMAVLIQFILFEEFSDKASPRYLTPMIRLGNFISGFVEYTKWAETAPYGPSVHVNKGHLQDGYINVLYLQSAGALMQTSIAPILKNTSVTEADVERFRHVIRIRDSLKPKLAPLQPFGMPEYLAQVRKARAQKRKVV
jgi:hypothetical protein